MWWTTYPTRCLGVPQGPSAHHFLTANSLSLFMVWAGAWCVWRGTWRSWDSKGRECCGTAGATCRLGGGDAARQGSWHGMVLVFTFFVLLRTCGRTNVRRNQGVMLKGNSLHKANPHSSTSQTCFLAFSQVGELAFGTCPCPGMTRHHRFLIGAAGARLEPRGPEGHRPYPNPSLAWLLAAALFPRRSRWLAKKTELRNQLL